MMRRGEEQADGAEKENGARGRMFAAPAHELNPAESIVIPVMLSISVRSHSGAARPAVCLSYSGEVSVAGILEARGAY
jgi:hypothetical protein